MKTHTGNARVEMIIALILLFTPFLTLKAQDEPITTSYLGADPYDTAGLKVLDDIIRERNFVFTSELHYHPYSLEAQKKFVAYLSGGNRLDILALEGDYAFGYEINHFFKTGDTLRLKSLFDLHPEMTVRPETADFYAHYISLKALRDSMKTDFDVKGIDVCYGGGFKGSVFTILQILELSMDSALVDVSNEGKSMLEKKRLRDNKVEEWTNKLNKKLKETDLSFTQSNQDKNRAELFNIIFNIEQSLRVRKDKMAEREFEISRNFRTHCKPNKRVFAQFGFSHVFANLERRYGFEENTVISFLNQDSAYANRSIVIQFMPWQGTSMYFPLLTDMERERIAPIVLEKPFPQLLDFRKMKSIEGAFDFAIIVEGTY